MKYQYLLSQTLMVVANQCGIDGIAYLSMKGEDEFQYPHGVNLAIPATDITEYMQYSEKCNGFNVSKPIKFSEQEGKNKSYINAIYTRKDSCGMGSFLSKVHVDGELQFYGDTGFAKFDNYLMDVLFSENRITNFD